MDSENAAVLLRPSEMLAKRMLEFVQTRPSVGARPSYLVPSAVPGLMC